MSGDNIRFFRTRADLALDLANRPENSDLRDKYLGLWREWSDQADHARSRRESGAQSPLPRA